MRLAGTQVRLLAVIVVTVLLGGSLAAVARADTEPNNGIAEAEGPMSGGVNYTGTIDTRNEIDTYVFYVSGEVPLSVHVVSASNSCLEATLGDTNNGTLQETKFYEGGESSNLTYTTTAGVNRFYLQVESCNEATGGYSFSISPGAAIVGGPAALTPNPVPGLHEYAEQAFGPLAANTAYSDTLLTSNDQNWLTFFTPLAEETVDVEATALVGGECSLYVNKEYMRMSWDRWSHDTFTSANSAQYFLSTEKCMGTSWEVIVKATSLAPGVQTQAAPPPPPSASNACLHARANLANAQLLVRRYRHKLGSHHLSRKARRNYHRALSHASVLVRRYVALRHSQCGR